MKTHPNSAKSGFTLLETVIAIGVLAVLLTGFMVVFAPAADGIRKSINVQQADRMTSALEQELVIVRNTDFTTGFNKAFDWIKNEKGSTDAILVYQYRGKMGSARADGTLTPEPALSGKPGADYVVVPMARRRSDTLLADDLKAVEGAVYLTKCTQLIFSGGQLTPNTTPKTIKDPKTGTVAASADVYPEAVIAFAAEFHMLPAKTASYISGTAFTTKFDNAKNPVFTRNLAVRR